MAQGNLEPPPTSAVEPYVLVLEDTTEVSTILQALGLRCFPCTHFQLLSETGQELFQPLHARVFNILLISLPVNC